ncbi:hypothetical protein GCM10027430_19930 [Lysobacter tyrosinilyticus]
MFSFAESSLDIALAFSGAVFTDEDGEKDFLGLSKDDFLGNLYSGSPLVWAPDGDAAFDDGSVVLQLDGATRVRLIGFRRDAAGGVIDLTDFEMNSDDFYELLESWSTAFIRQWELMSG